MKRIAIPSDAKGLIVDDSISRRAWFLSSFRIPQAYVTQENAQAIDIVKRGGIDWLFLDSDLGPGVDTVPLAEYLRDSEFAGKIVIISANPFGRDVLAKILPGAMVCPFGEFELARGK